jgi:hypothetical protein
MIALAWPLVFLALVVLGFTAAREVLAHVKERATAGDVRAEHVKALEILQKEVADLRSKVMQERTAQALAPRRL